MVPPPLEVYCYSNMADWSACLALSVTRDESSLVGIEAIRALAGHFPPRKASLRLDGKAAEVSAQDVRSRGRAWQASCYTCQGQTAQRTH